VTDLVVDAGRRRTRLLPRDVQLPTLVVASATILLVMALTAIRAAGADIEVLPLQLALLGLFCALAALDFRVAAALAIFELVLGGAGGRWTVLPGGISGRNVFDAVVVLAAVASAAQRERVRTLIRNSYLWHALALAAIFGGVWFTLGFINGHTPKYVVQDGNGLLFFGFMVVIVVLASEVGSDWIRRVLLAACILNAVIIAALDLAVATHVIALRPTLDEILIRLQMGGVSGVLPDGSFRLSPASALYLQVGLAIVTAALLRRPRRVGLWAVFALLWIGVVMSYTRGYWVGALVAVVLALAFGTSRWRSLGAVVAGTLALAIVAVSSLALLGFSLRAYVVDRALGTVRQGSSAAAASHAPSRLSKGKSLSAAASAQDNSPNLLLNGSFERGVAGWYSVPGTSVAASAFRTHGGRASARLSHESGPDSNLGYSLLTLPPVRVTVSAWAYVPRLSRQTSITLNRELFDNATGAVGAPINMREAKRWQRVAFSFRPSRTDLLGALVFRAASQPPPGFNIWVDDVRVVAPLIRDGSFERGTRGWTPAPSAAIARTTGTAHSGVAAAKLKYRARETDYKLAYTTLAVAPAPTEASAWVRIPASWPSSAMVALSAERFAGAVGRTIAFADQQRHGRWQSLKLAFTPSAGDLQGYLAIRLMRPPTRGAIDIDDVVARQQASAPQASATPPSAGDLAALSDKVRREQARVLWRYIVHRPVEGYGFGAVAPELRRSPLAPHPYSYELAYFDLAFKTGLLGLVLFFSFPMRLLVDAIRIRLGRRRPPAGMARHDAAVPIAIICSVIVTGATNPYVLAAFGLFPLLAAVAWIDTARVGSPDIRNTDSKKGEAAASTRTS
jgi:hypothetical protein